LGSIFLECISKGVKKVYDMYIVRMVVVVVAWLGSKEDQSAIYNSLNTIPRVCTYLKKGLQSVAFDESRFLAPGALDSLVDNGKQRRRTASCSAPCYEAPCHR
jgi:phage gp37-like protein